MSKLVFAVNNSVQINQPLLELSLSSHWNGTPESSWPLLILKRPLTRWTGRQYGKSYSITVPWKIIYIIQCLYSSVECQVIHDRPDVTVSSTNWARQDACFCLFFSQQSQIRLPDELTEQEELVYSGLSHVSQKTQNLLYNQK